MKRFASVLVVAVMLLAFASVAMGAIGWAGQIWPVNGTSYTSNDDIEVYVQVWKEGVTEPEGQGADIAAYLYYRCSGVGDLTQIPMDYWGDVGNNDEYRGVISAGHGCDIVEFLVEVVDLSDGAVYLGAQDQNGNDPPFFLPITQVTSQDVTVRFHLCLTGETTTTGVVCVTGNHDELTNWSHGVVMMFSCEEVSPKLYQVDVLFAAGSNPYVEYKYRKDECETWEDGGNRSFMIDDSSSFMDLPWVDGWSWTEPDCPECGSPVEDATWGTIKGIYR